MGLDKERENINFLKSVTGSPQVFLEAQNELLYSQSLDRFYHKGEVVGEVGLPESTDEFYMRSEVQVPKISDRMPRVLNIGSGAEASRNLPAVNIDLSGGGKPTVIADARYLPFRDGVFSVVRASHVLEHVPQDQISATLNEWKRVTHLSGELQIAVPDADITFDEIVQGKTPKGDGVLSYARSTAPLAQIYGLGYDNPDTDPRWLHSIIFSEALLEDYLKNAGFGNIEKRRSSEDLAYYSGIDDDSQNHYSLLVSARNEREVQMPQEALREREFRKKCAEFVELYLTRTPSSYVIPVHNESKNLPHFLSFLENIANQLDTEREFIFVVNGSTDDSEEIIQSYIPESYLKMKIKHSDTGIMQAFEAGIEAREYDGFVGKLDVDTILHPHSLDLMEMNLTEKSELQATYAEPTPFDAQQLYNEAEHNPLIRSKRLYIHGRSSLYRGDPFAELNDRSVIQKLSAEDIFLSFYLAYHFGLDSMASTPHALVYSKTVISYDDLVKQLSRNASEMQRVFDVFPPFRSLDKLLQREIYPGPYQEVIFDAKTKINDTLEGWPPLKSR